MEKYQDAFSYKKQVWDSSTDEPQIKNVLLTRSLKLSSCNAYSVYCFQGEMHKREMEYYKSFKKLKIAIILEPNNYHIIPMFAEVLLNLDRLEEILPFAKKFFQKFPTPVGFHGILIQVSKKTEKLEAFYKEISEALPSDKMKGDLYYYAGYHLIQEKRYEQALQFLKKVLEFCPDKGHYRTRYGTILHKLGLLQEAMMEFERAKSLKHDGYNDFDLRRRIANLKYDIMRVEEAIEEIKLDIELYIRGGFYSLHLELCVMLYHLYEEEADIAPYTYELMCSLKFGEALALGNEEIRLAKLKLESQLDEKNRNFNLQKIKAWNAILNFAYHGEFVFSQAP